MRVNLRRWLLAAGILFVFPAFGCVDKATPEEVLASFLKNLKNRRAVDAYAALAATNQRELTERASKIATLTGAKEPPDAAHLLYEVADVTVLRAAESISVVSPIGSEVLLRVSVAGGESAQVRMVREGADWKVDLLGSLTPPRPTTTSTAPPG